MARRALDDTDRHLLTLLEENARRPVVWLARAVGLSRSAVQERLARLEDDGAIARYTIVRGNMGAAPSVRALLLVTIATRPCETVLSRIRDWPEILSCWSVASPTTDAVMVVEAADGERLGDLRERLGAVPGISEIVTAPVLRTVISRASE